MLSELRSDEQEGRAFLHKARGREASSGLLPSQEHPAGRGEVCVVGVGEKWELVAVLGTGAGAGGGARSVLTVLSSMPVGRGTRQTRDEACSGEGVLVPLTPTPQDEGPAVHLLTPVISWLWGQLRMARDQRRACWHLEIQALGLCLDGSWSALPSAFYLQRELSSGLVNSHPGPGCCHLVRGDK